MRSAGDDGVADRKSLPGGSADGSFDPGTGAGYDDRRARKAARRQRREGRERRGRELKEEERDRRKRATLIAESGMRSAAGGAAAAAALEPEPALDLEPAPPPAERKPVGDPAPVTELHGLRPRRRSLADRLAREREERKGQERARLARVEPALRRRFPTPAGVARTPRPVRRRELVWPTAKAGVAVTIMLGVAAALGSVLGLPVPGLKQANGNSSLLSSATLFGVGPGTPQGLADGYVFPLGAARPVDYGEKAAKFGADRYSHAHEGQDVFAKPGTPLFAVRDGIVVDGGGGKSLYAYGGGNAIVIYSPTDDRSYAYLHLLRASPLRAGDQVHAGQEIGQVGCTGSCDGPHLHFEIRRGRVAYGHEGKPVDPLPYLRQWEQFGTQ